MKITFEEKDKEKHDCILGQLRKHEDGSDDLTVEQWLVETFEGKANACARRINPTHNADTRNTALKEEINALKRA